MDELLKPSQTVSFADVAHQTLLFDRTEPDGSLVLALLDTPWVQRLRNIRQTGNTHLVYMFAEHSRFGHSLGVAYLAILLMRNVARFSPEPVEKYRAAVAAAALLHDVGHVAPGSHLAERLWSNGKIHHETVSCRIIEEDPTIRGILDARDPSLVKQVQGILENDPKLPPWTHSVISGGGWNADRGNWMIVDSALCSVSYGRYNVLALLDAFRITPKGELVLLESRLDALTHFFVARDSMYRQVYQHRVLQAVDALTEKLILRLSDLILKNDSEKSLTRAEIETRLGEHKIFADQVLVDALFDRVRGEHTSLDTVFRMTESWWTYHRDQWCNAGDEILRDLAIRLRDRRLLKTVRVERTGNNEAAIVREAEQQATRLGFDPRYYVTRIENADLHRGKFEEPPLVLLDNGRVVPVTQVEPMIAKLSERLIDARTWLAVPQEVKTALGVNR